MSWLTPELLEIFFAVVKAVVILLAVVICGALLSWVERRLLALWQDRYGPNRVGPFGAFQIAAVMIKMLFKEDWTSPFADKMVRLDAGQFERRFGTVLRVKPLLRIQPARMMHALRVRLPLQLVQPRPDHLRLRPE